MLKIARFNDLPEIFYTIQGEGKNLGQPSVFVRLSLCNLYCFWCDTDYTWNWKGTKFAHVKDSEPGYQKFEKASHLIQLTNEEIINEITRHGCSNLVFTGGEPLAQQKELESLFLDLKNLNDEFRIEVETNGTVLPTDSLDQFVDQYNVSVKLTNSRVAERERVKPEVISFFAQTPKANFKFVIDTPLDLDEVLELIDRFSIKRKTVYLMPQGRNATALKDKQQWLIERCKEFGVNYTDRLHIHIYGDKRGV